jgi:hypothetical protein
MHTTKIGNVTFHHDGDYDGPIVIYAEDAGRPQHNAKIRIDIEELIEFIAGAVRAKQLLDFEAKLDRTTDRGIVGF